MNRAAAAVTEPTLSLRHPELGTGPIPTDIYYRPEIYTQELEAIFKRTWIWVGRVDQVREPGQFFVRQIPTFGYSVLICRDRDGA